MRLKITFCLHFTPIQSSSLLFLINVVININYLDSDSETLLAIFKRIKVSYFLQLEVFICIIHDTILLQINLLLISLIPY